MPGSQIHICFQVSQIWRKDMIKQSILACYLNIYPIAAVTFYIVFAGCFFFVGVIFHAFSIVLECTVPQSGSGSFKILDRGRENKILYWLSELLLEYIGCNLLLHRSPNVVLTETQCMSGASTS